MPVNPQISQRAGSLSRRRAHAFTTPPRLRPAKLISTKRGIIEAPQNSELPRVFRNLHAILGMAVSAATIARFLVDLNHNSALER